MDPSDVLVWIKAVVVAGFAGYLSLFVLNNLTDRGTNSGAIVRMMTMRELREDPDGLGRGVVWRAVDSPAVHRGALYAVVVVQAATAVLLWRAAVLLVGAGVAGAPADTTREAVAAADRSRGCRPWGTLRWRPRTRTGRSTAR